MQPHPDFADTALPRAAVLEPFRLTPLSEAAFEEDFDVITSSQHVLNGLLWGSDWPSDATRASSLTDLHWHDREFTAKRSFSWIVRDHREAYIGCAYLFPNPGMRRHGEVITWMRAGPDRINHLKSFNARFREWLPAFLPEGYTVSWTSNDDTFAKSA